MSVMSDIADEALKPVKKGIFIVSAVTVTGAIVLGANSKTGRKFLGKVKEAAFGDGKPETDPKQIADKGEEVVIDVKAEPVPEPTKQMIGANNV